MQRQRKMQMSLLRTLLKAAKRIDADPALRAIITTPAEYTNMYNHYGERWEGPLLQVHDRPAASPGAPPPPMPVSHAFFAFLQEMNGGKSFYSPHDESAHARIFPRVMEKARALNELWKKSQGEVGDANSAETKAIAAAFFAIKCTQALFDVLPVVEPKSLRKSAKGKKGSLDVPLYLSALKALKDLPIISDTSEDAPLTGKLEQKTEIITKKCDKRRKKTVKAAKTSQKGKEVQKESAHFLVAHPMLDQCFRHAIILISSHKPGAAAHVSVKNVQESAAESKDAGASLPSAAKLRLRTPRRSSSSTYDPDASMGWVINMPIRAKSGEPLRVSDLKLHDHDDTFNTCLQSNIVYTGGPIGSPTTVSSRSQHALFLLYCGPLSLSALQNIKAEPGTEATTNGSASPKVIGVAPGVHSICDPKHLQALMRAGKVKKSEILVILGYSGWGRSQLDGEVLQGTWFPASLAGAANVRSLMLSYQKNDAVEPLAVFGKKRTQKSVKDLKLKGKKVLRAKSTEAAPSAPETAQTVQRTPSAVPFPITMWRDFLHAMGPAFQPMTRLGAVLPLRVMSP